MGGEDLILIPGRKLCIHGVESRGVSSGDFCSEESARILTVPFLRASDKFMTHHDLID
jgi:hypothetical protein